MEDGERAGQPSPPRQWRVQVQQPQPRPGRDRGPARRGLADPAQPGGRHRGTAMSPDAMTPDFMNTALPWLEWTGVHMSPWKLIGLTGALMFGGRWLVQFLASRREGKPVIPPVQIGRDH